MSDLDHMDGLAAEYVLGTLDVEEREQVRTLLDADAAFAAKVESWERRFGDLYLMVEPVEPDSAIWPRIKAKMLGGRERTRATEPPIPAPASAAEPPSLDAIEAVISETATTLSSEATSTAAEEAPPASIPEALPTTAAEATPAPGSEAPAAAATPAPASEGTSAPVPELPPAPTLHATGTSAVEAVPSPPVAAASAEAARQASSEPQAPSEPAPSEPQASSEPQAQTAAPATLSMHRRLRRWRAFAVLMTLVVVAVAALLAAWRFAPDRVPSMLQPLELMRQAGVPLPGIPAPRRPAPPESRFDE